MRGLLIGGILILSLLAQGAGAQENPKWKRCQTDADCVVVGSGCVLIAVNTAFRAEGEAYSAEKNTRVECPETLDPTKFSAICAQSPFPCSDGSHDACLSKMLKCTLKEQPAGDLPAAYDLE